MSFFQKIKLKFQQFMTGRNGTDELSFALLIASIVLSLISSILSGVQNSTVCSILSMVLHLVGMAGYIFCLYRMFSRNVEKRRAENRRYISFREKKSTEAKQAAARFRNRKKYKYFKCPGCKCWTRLPRGAGVVTLTCKRCHTSFTQKS